MFGWTDAEAEVFHRQLTKGVIWSCPIIFLWYHFAPPIGWGKTTKTILGVTLPARLGWCLMESPNLYWAVISYYQSPYGAKLPTVNAVLLALFVGHYFNRTIVYPLSLNPQSRPLPVEIVLAAFLYTNINGYLQTQGLCRFQTSVYPEDYLLDPVFWLGLAVFGCGVAINWQSDHILRNLKKKGTGTKKNDDGSDQNGKTTNTATTATGSGYVIPRGGFFTYVSAPHYFGEIVEWIGYALACQSLAAWCFAIFTCANLIPRGLAHHRWYLEHFPKEYPRLQRKAVIPFVW